MKNPNKRLRPDQRRPRLIKRVGPYVEQLVTLFDYEELELGGAGNVPMSILVIGGFASAYWEIPTPFFVASLIWFVFPVLGFINFGGGNWFSLMLIFCEAACLVFFAMFLVWGPNVSPDHPLVAPDNFIILVWLLSRSLPLALVVTLVPALVARRDLLSARRSRSRPLGEDMGISMLISATYGGVGVISLFLWTIIGFVSWIMLLARATILFVVAVLHDILTDGGGIEHAQRDLDVAASFYVNGFIRIIEAVREWWNDPWYPDRSWESAALEEEETSLLVSAIYIAVGAVLLFSWTIIGFVFWIPMLVRTTILFMVVVLHDSLTGSGEVIGQGQRGLDVAVTFYVNGFIRITEALRRRRVVGKSEQHHPTGWGRMALELLWSIAVWSVGLWALFGFPAFWMQ